MIINGYLTKRVKIQRLIEDIICSFFLVPLLGFFIGAFFMDPSVVSQSADIPIPKEELLIALRVCGKICLYGMPIVIVVIVFRMLWNSDTVVFTDEAILYYRWIFAKKHKKLSYEQIQECLVSHGLLGPGGRGILFTDGEKKIAHYELNPNMILVLLEKFPEDKIRFVGEDCRPMSINEHFNLKFSLLPVPEKLFLIKHYCKLNKSYKNEDGEKLLKKFRRKMEKRTRSF